MEDAQPRNLLPFLSSIQARLLVEAVVHFPLTLAEVTLGASPGGKVSFRNYLEEETGKLSTLTLLAKILTPLHSG